MGGIELNYPAHLRNQLLLQAQPPGTAAVRCRVKHAGVRVDSEPVNRNRGQTAPRWNPRARACLQYINAEIGRHEQVSSPQSTAMPVIGSSPRLLSNFVHVAVCVVGS